MQPDETGRLTYEAYVRAKDGSDHAAGKIRWRPRWEWLVPEEQDAWRQAAVNDGERVTILRSDEKNPPRISRCRHPKSIAALFNMPFDFKPIEYDPMSLA